MFAFNGFDGGDHTKCLHLMDLTVEITQNVALFAFAILKIVKVGPKSINVISWSINGKYSMLKENEIMGCLSIYDVIFLSENHAILENGYKLQEYT